MCERKMLKEHVSASEVRAAYRAERDAVADAARLAFWPEAGIAEARSAGWR